MQSHLLKYKYGMNPLTVTWSPHLYTDIGWKNFQNWLHVGGFDNYLYTPNGKVHRLLLTRNATINLLHRSSLSSWAKRPSSRRWRCASTFR